MHPINCSLEAEHVYSKALSKMALKLNKTCREIPGSLAEVWRAVATEMESRGEVHRQFSKSLAEEIVKPLKEILDGQHKTRKTVCEPNSDHAFNYILLSYYKWCGRGCNCRSICFIIGVATMIPRNNRNRWNCLVLLYYSYLVYFQLPPSTPYVDGEHCR